MANHHNSYPRRIGNWYLLERLGAGYSGCIFRAVNIHDNRQIVALKLQDVNHECPTNIYEKGFYPQLQGGIGMPTLWAEGVEGKWDYLAIDLLGPSLDSLYKGAGKKVMDLRSITRLEFMHSRGILHRDIQLGNCTIGLPPNEKTIYMIDFGFSKRYIDPRTKQHIPDSKVKRDFIGNYWFSSIRVHCKGQVPSRRDDLEAAALMFIHLLTPNGLPWTRFGVPKTDHAHTVLKRAKSATLPGDLCRGMPVEFEDFLRYCRKLRFTECPDYQRWVETFRVLAEDRGFGSSDDFIWPPLPLLPVQHHTQPRLPQRTPLSAAPAMENVVNALAELKLEPRPVLVDRKNIVVAAKPGTLPQLGVDGVPPKKFPAPSLLVPQLPPQKTPPPKAIIANVVDLTDTQSDDSSPTPLLPHQARINKAAEFMRLTKNAKAAGDNTALAQVIGEFVVVVNGSRSKNLTREGFEFLDALHKQLTDPSVFAVPQPIRTLRARSRGSGDVEASGPAKRRAKMNALLGLRQEASKAQGNGVLGALVAEFGALTVRSTGRVVTKDGVAFLEGVKARLEMLAKS